MECNNSPNQRLGIRIPRTSLYFHQSCILHTKAFAPSTTTTTIGNGGNTKGSTEVDDVTGHKCAMTQHEYLIFTMLVLDLCPGKMHGTKRSKSSFINMLLEVFVSISNLAAVFTLNEPTDRKGLAQILAYFSILLLGAEAITPTIIEQVWGQNNVARCKLGRSRGDLALIHCQLISLACVANNAYHLWLTTTFNDGTIIPSNTLQYLPPGVRDILQIVTK